MSEKTVNPWRTNAVRVIYDSPWLRLEEHDAINPAGKSCDYGKVCFKNQAVGILPIDEAGNTWLVGQHRYTLNAYSWEIPEGGSPAGEAPEETAARELKEETGLEAADIALFCTLHTSNSVTDEEGFIYLATGLAEGETEFEDTEDITVRKLPFEEALAMAMNGEITDAMSLAALFKYALLQGK
jgi:8-oxo-dGTP pyrophosphatase MutT (NUDIX family)